MIKPLKVLCTYKFWARVDGLPVSLFGAIIIKSYTSRDIHLAFHREMSRRFNEKTEFFNIGPTPIIFELFSYLPENGKENFNCFRDTI
jgi:hypothetical protein